MQKRETPEWREFEIRVAALERQLSPHGARVMSPDRIRDRVTGRMREVDASVRAPRDDGTEDLTTIECRRRGSRQDDVWIEQLACKRDKIGAARTIAVSSKGFSKSAQKSAAHFGILLKTATELTSDETVRVMMGMSIGATITDFHTFIHRTLDASGTEISEVLLAVDGSGEISVGTPIVYNRVKNQHLTMERIAQLAGDADIAVDGKRYKKTAVMRMNPGECFVRTASGETEVSGLDVTVIFCRHHQTAAISNVTDYGPADGTPAMRYISGQLRTDHTGYSIQVTMLPPLPPRSVG